MAVTAEIAALEMASSRAAVNGYLPYVRAEIDQMRSALLNKTQADLAAGKLTPETALYAWQEYFTLQRILHRLEQKAKIPTAG